MKNSLLIYVFFFIYTFCFCQQKGVNISGIISDSVNNAPIPNASIKVDETNFTALSDNEGCFSVWIEKIPAVLNFSHIGYRSKIIKINSSSVKYLDIRLRGKINELHELSVTAGKPFLLTANQPLYITDYEFSGNKIIVLAYKNKIFSKACLCLMNLDGDTICSVHVKNPKALYKDCFGDNHLLSVTTAWRVFIDSGKVSFLYPEDVELFEQAFNPVVAELNDIFFYRKYYYNNQVLQYYYYDKNVKKSVGLKVIASESNLFMMRDKARIIAGSANPEIQERFENMAFYKPVFAPLVKIHDTICIFNYEDSLIEFYSGSCKLLKEVPVSFHNNRYWKREIFVDDVKGKVYTLFRKNGVSTLKEINLKNGELKNSVVIPEFPFIEKIKIHNDNVYFLYTERNNEAEYKKLYRMKI